MSFKSFKVKNTKLSEFGGPWVAEDQEFNTTLDYIGSLRPAWTV